MNRRYFLHRLSLSVAGMALLPSCGIKTSNKIDNQSNVILKAGICADVHRDIIPDNELRLQAFIDNMNERGDVDFIIQLGDFVNPYDYNIPFMNIWKKFQGPGYHVMGNHDTDYNFTQDQAVTFLGMKSPYYSFDTNGYHFIVLNGNESDPANPIILDGPRTLYTNTGYDHHIGEEQRRWLADDIDKTNLPVIVFCHQSLDEKLLGVDQATAAHVRLIFEKANEKTGFKKIRLVFSGHHHTDFHNIINDIHYLSINSMSFIWMGWEFKSEYYSKEIEEKYPLVKYIIPYKDPLWAVMTIYENGEIAIEGKQSGYSGTTPEETGIVSPWHIPCISDRRLT